MQFSYNLANLPSKVEGLAQGANAGLTLNYRYLSDGTKVSATLSDGDTTEGLRYRGSFVYLVKDGKEVLSSIPWSDGRIEYVYDFPVPVEGDGLGEEELASDEPQLLEIVDCWHVTDHLGSTRAVVALNQDGAVLEQNGYLPFGTRYDVAAPLAYGTGDNRYRFAGKEEQRFGQDPLSGASRIDLGLLDFGARLYDPFSARWTTRDPLARKYLPVSPYGYCAGNPVNRVDPRGEETHVIQNEDGTYKIIGGILNDDKNIYLFTPDKDGCFTVKGSSIGITTSTTTFYNSDEGAWAINSIIDLNDLSGTAFLSSIENNTPLLINYIVNARHGKKYDFKATGGTDSIKYEESEYYRGMPVGETFDGKKIISSARDIGNIAAGYVAASRGIPWIAARVAFDIYQSLGDHDFKRESISSQNAQRYGWQKGLENNIVYRVIRNTNHFITKWIEYNKNKLFGH